MKGCGRRFSIVSRRPSKRASGLPATRSPATSPSRGWGRLCSQRSLRTARRCGKTSRRRSEVSPEPQHRLVVRLDRLLEEREMTLAELATRVDVTIVNLSVLKNGRARDPLLDPDSAVRCAGMPAGRQPDSPGPEPKSHHATRRARTPACAGELTPATCLAPEGGTRIEKRGSRLASCFLVQEADPQ
jgi:hypothetical protein